MSATPKGYERFSTLSPQQQSIFDQVLGSLTGKLGGEGVDRFKAPYLREFNEQIIPGIANRFSGLGAQKSSGFQHALGQAGADLEERLAKIGGEQENNALAQLLSLLGLSTEGLVKKELPWWQQGLVGASQGLGQGLGQGAGGAIGGGLGWVGSLLGGLFGKKSSQPGGQI